MKNACDVSGTVTSVRIMTNDFLKCHNINNDILLSQEIQIINKMIVGVSNNMGGGIIEWYKQAFFPDDNADIYHKMESQANVVNAGSNGVVFLPYLLGERAPVFIPNASASFFGLTRKTMQKDITRSVFESCAYVTNDLLKLTESEGFHIDQISVSGGLARFDLINQIKADVTNKKVNVLENFESTSVGAFIFLALSLGIIDYDRETLNKIIRIRKTVYPSKRNNAIYCDYYNLYTHLRDSLSESYKMQKSLLAKGTIDERDTLQNL